MRSIIVIIAILLLAGCSSAAKPQGAASSTVGCSTKDAAAVKTAIDPQIAAFADQTTLAGTTSRIALSPVIGQMQTTRRAVAQLTLPACADAARTLLTAYMDARIAEYLAFAAQHSDTEVAGDATAATTALGYAQAALKLLGIEAR